jgi:PAS domain S-box-containing protein
MNICRKYNILFLIVFPALLSLFGTFTVFIHFMYSHGYFDSELLIISLFLIVFAIINMIGPFYVVFELQKVVHYFHDVTVGKSDTRKYESKIREIQSLLDGFEQFSSKLQEFHQTLQRTNRHLKARASAIIDAASEAIVGVDSDLKINIWNVAAEKMFGVPESKVLGQEFTQYVLPTEQQILHKRKISEFFSRQAEGHSVRYQVIAKDLTGFGVRVNGVQFPVEVTVCQVSQNDLVAFIRDITERKRIEFERNTYIERLERDVANRTKELESLNKTLRTSSEISTAAFELVSRIKSHG